MDQSSAPPDCADPKASEVTAPKPVVRVAVPSSWITRVASPVKHPDAMDVCFM